MPGRDFDEQRLAFGAVAELYDRVRPSYPSEAVDALIEYGRLAPGAEVAEVGAGTGKGTRLLAGRGLQVLALEPDPAMAAVARRNCAGLAGVRIEPAGFEEWVPVPPVSAIVSFQAWHWTDPATRYEHAADALVPGGCLAAIWTVPEWSKTPMRDVLLAVYARQAPALVADFAMHPATARMRLAGDWLKEISATRGFAEAEVLGFPWDAGYSASDYRAMLETHQDHIRLRSPERDRLLDGIYEAVRAGGEIRLRFVTRVCLARRV